MTSEFELPCATCGTTLTRRTVTGDQLPFDVHGRVPVAECGNCGGRYFPEQALERVARHTRERTT